MRASKGFTLIELLVVITIMSILTVITVSQFETARRKARDVQRKADLSSVYKALQMYYADYGVFPESDDISWGGTFEDTTSSPPYVYMKVMPRESRDGVNPYCYLVSTDRKKFALMAQLENQSDRECDKDGDGTVESSEMSRCGGASYCYYTVSPNTSLDGSGNFDD